MKKVGEQVEGSALAQLRLLIRHWLHDVPAENPDDFIEQSAAALWLEARYFQNMSKIFGGK